MKHAIERASAPNVDPRSGPKPRDWPRWLRRGPMEMVASCLIAAGVFMLLQPFSMTLFGWSFLVTLVGTGLFTVVSKFPG